MAKKIHEEDIKLNIIVGSNKAQKELYELEAANRKLRTEQSELYKIKNKLEAQGKKETAEYKRATSRLRELRKEIRSNSSRMKELTEQIGITSLTMNQLNQRARTLRAAIYNMVPGSAQRRKLQKELDEITARMNKLRAASHQQSLTWSSAANWLNKYQAMLVGFAATLTGVTLTFQKWLDYSGKIADQQADVRKTTGMTMDEVKGLTSAVADLDTRTSRLDLLKIAEEGGRIGLAKEEIHGFVRVMDQAVVALGDTFTGGVEEVASVLGKLRFLFEETAEMGVEEAYLSIGSALNELGANGVATERNIAEFATRLGSLPKQLKPTVAEALALGASFEESGIKAEIASRAYSIFMNRAAKNTAEFAKVMGITTKEAEDLLNSDPTEFFLQFGEALGKSNVSATQMSQLLQKMGINADGANKIVGAISNNTSRFRQQIDLSNRSLQEATSLTEEFEVKNENLRGTLDKIQKRLAAIFTSEDIMNWLERAVEWFAKFIGAAEDADGKVEKFRQRLVTLAKVFAIVIAALVSYRAAVLLTAVWTNTLTKAVTLLDRAQKVNITTTKLLTAAKSGLRGLLILCRAAFYFFTLQVRAADAQMKLFNATVRMNPLGGILSLLGLAATAFYVFRDSAKEATSFHDKLADANNRAAESISKTANEIQSLINVIKDENISLATRKEAYEDLVKIAPEFNGYLEDEKFNIEGLTAAYDHYIRRLQEVAEAKALSELSERATADVVKEDVSLRAIERRLANERAKLETIERFVDKPIYGKNSGKIIGWTQAESAAYQRQKEVIKSLEKERLKQLENLEAASSIREDVTSYINEEVKVLDKEIELVKRRIEEYKKIDSDLARSIVANNELELRSLIARRKALLGPDAPTSFTGEETEFSPVSGGDDKEDKERERRINELISENEKLANEILQIRRKLEDDQLAIQQAGFEKEMRQLEIEHKRRIEDLQSQKVDQKTLAALGVERNKAVAANDNERVRLIDELSAQLRMKNEELENSILQSTINYEYERNRIRVKYANVRLNNLQKEFEDRQKLREQEINQELIDLGTVEAVKERLRDSLSKKELDSIKTWEDAKRALRKEYQEDEIEDEINHYTNLMHELQNAWESGMVDGIEIELLTDEEKEKFLSQINEIKQKLIELGILKADLQNQTSSEDYSGSYGSFGSVDILGLSQEDWQRFIDNINDGIFELQELAAVVGMLQNAFAQYYAYVQAQERRNLDLFERSVNRRRDSLKRQLDSGILSHEEYDKKMQDLEEKAEKRRAEMEYKAAMQQYRQSIMNAISGTALMIINAAQTKPFVPAGLAMASVASIMGAIQLATIRQNKPIKGYEKGLYNNELFDVIREQDGKKFKASYGGETKTGIVKTPTVFMAGERGPEMIIDNEAFSRFHPDLKRDLYREIARVKGFESGLYRNPTGIDESSKAIENLLIQNNILMEQNNSLLTTLTEIYGRTELVLDYEAIRKIKKVEDEYNNHQNKNRV